MFREHNIVGDSTEPVAWVTREVLHSIACAAAFGAPHQVSGTLLGHWVTPRREVVISGWNGFACSVFRHAEHGESRGAPSAASDVERSPDGPRVAQGASTELGPWLGLPEKLASQRRPSEIAARLAPSSLASTGLVLILSREGESSWAPGLWLDPAVRRPWGRLRRPIRVRLRLFTTPERA